MDRYEFIEKYQVKKDSIITHNDGRIEWLCEHGEGHFMDGPPGSDYGHKCDGCCHTLQVEEAKRRCPNPEEATNG